MDNSIRLDKKMAKKIVKWLLKDLERDFDIILEPPTEEEICQNLEELPESD